MPSNCSSRGNTPLEGTHSRYHEATHAGEKPFICSTLETSHHQKGNMTTRARKQHAGKKPFACPQCHKALTGSKLQRVRGPIPPRRSHPILPSGRHVPSAPRRATHCSPQEESGYMVIRGYDPDDVTLQGVVTPSQANQEEASETPKKLTGRHISYRGGSLALRQRRPTERPADVPRKGPILTSPQQRGLGITDATTTLKQKSGTV